MRDIRLGLPRGMRVSENEYGNYDIRIGVGHDINGVQLYIKHPITGEQVRVMQVEPEFARTIAHNFTLASFECEDLRRERDA